MPNVVGKAPKVVFALPSRLDIWGGGTKHYMMFESKPRY